MKSDTQVQNSLLKSIYSVLSRGAVFNRRFKLALLLLLGFSLLGNARLVLALVAEEPSNWSLVSADGGIESYTRDVEGSLYKAARHVAEIDTSVEKVLAAFGNGSQCLVWLKLCKSAQIINRVSEREFLGYAVLNMPWPVSDRDLVFRSTSTHEPATGTIEINQVSEPGAYPKSKLVRMISDNTYKIEPLGEHRSRLTWTVHSNPGGKLSVAMVNSKVHSNTLRDLRSLIALLDKS